MPVRVEWRRSGIEPGGANEGGGTVLPVAGGRKRKETETPEGGGRGAKGTKDGRVGPPLPFPAATGNSG